MVETNKKDWEIKTLGEVCEFISRGISPKYTESKGLVVVNQKCIRNHVVNLELARLHDNDLKAVATEKFIKNGDVLINSTGTGTLGRVAQVTEDIKATVDSHVTIVRPNTEIFDKRFFAWVLFSLEKEIEESGAGASGQTELSRDTVRNFIVSYPKSKNEQKRIVKILDEKFGVIEELKQVAQQQIIDAKELFESRLSEVFSNPVWDQKRFDEVCVLQRGFDLPTRLRKKGNYPLMSANGITDYVHDFKVSGPGITTGRSGSIGFIHYIESDFWPLNTALFIKDYKGNEIKFVYYFLKSFNIGRYSSGAGVPTLNRNHVHSELVQVTSDIKEQKKIVVELDALSEKTKELEAIFRRKIADLEELKKSYLQDAFAGKL